MYHDKMRLLNFAKWFNRISWVAFGFCLLFLPFALYNIVKIIAPNEIYDFFPRTNTIWVKAHQISLNIDAVVTFGFAFVLFRILTKVIYFLLSLKDIVEKSNTT